MKKVILSIIILFCSVLVTNTVNAHVGKVGVPFSTALNVYSCSTYPGDNNFAAYGNRWGSFIGSITAIPPGLAFDNATGFLSGIPTTVGTYYVDVWNFPFSWNGGQTECVGAGLYVVISDAVATPTPPAIMWSLGGAIQGVYNWGWSPLSVFTDTNSPALPLTYSVSNLPIGMVFDPIGRNISGTPVSAGTFTVGYHAFNGTNTGSTTFDIIVRPISLIAPAMVNYGGLVNGQPINGTISLPVFTESYQPYQVFTITHSVTGLPVGLSFDPVSRIISGTPGASGVYIITYTASNFRYSASTQFTITVNPGINSSINGTKEFDKNILSLIGNATSKDVGATLSDYHITGLTNVNISRSDSVPQANEKKVRIGTYFIKFRN